MRLQFMTLVSLGLMTTFISFGLADDSPPPTEESSAASARTDSATAESATKPGASPAPKPKPPEHVALLKDSEKKSGLLTLWKKDGKLYTELTGKEYKNEYLVLISIAQGIGRGYLVGGMTWNLGDEWIWKFRKVDRRVLVIRKNTRFRAGKSGPLATALKYAYSDSVLFSIPIITKGPRGGDLIDLSTVFMTDLPQISQRLPGFTFSRAKSIWGPIKTFQDNVELRVAATYASGGTVNLESVADSRGATVTVHYSISRLQTTGYQPRLADDRIGYFLTVAKDYSKKNNEEQYTRYINRWHLQKAEPEAKISPPKTPLVFWIENTVPFKYRSTVRAGIEEWNKAFEKTGITGAIEVRGQDDNDQWDAEDINYNTIRWITAGASFAGFGPTRVNPYTGQILDADILLDSASVRNYNYFFDTLEPAGLIPAAGGPLDPQFFTTSTDFNQSPKILPQYQCQLGHGRARELAFGESVLSSIVGPKLRDEEIEKLVLQSLKSMVMHEVGHTLGLRHNFKGSSYLSIEDLNNVEKTRETGMIGSVMDYDPVNLVPKEMQQGDYFTSTIGPYDYWAIEYGYKSLPGGTNGELEPLKTIASRSGETGLAYSTDEDARSLNDPDPDSATFDLGNDQLTFAKLRAQVVSEALPELGDRVTKEGDSYARLRRSLSALLHHHASAAYNASRYVGGIHISRSHKGDKDASAPMTLVDPQKQRDTLAMLEEQIFSDKPFQISPELYNQALPSRWNHWGVNWTSQPDFPVHSVISSWQDLVLSRLISTMTLRRIHDNELRIPADQDALTVVELLQGLTKAIFAEVDQLGEGDYTDRQPAVSSIRRNLQRLYLRRLSNLALGRSSAPEDCETIAYSELSSLEARINNLLKGNIKLDNYSRSHFEGSAVRIRKVLEADLSLSGP